MPQGLEIARSPAILFSIRITGQEALQDALGIPQGLRFRRRETLGLESGIEAELPPQLGERGFLPGRPGIKAGEDPAFPLRMSNGEDDYKGPRGSVPCLIQTAAPPLSSIGITNEDHGVRRFRSSREKEKGFPRHGGIQSSRLVLKVSVGSYIELSGQLADPMPLKVAGAFLQTAPVAIKIKAGGIDPFHLLTKDSIRQDRSQEEICRGLADDGKRVGGG